jgi:acetyl esterase/lipase
MIRPTTLALFLAAIVPATLSSQDQTENGPPIPSTISAEAQAFLREARTAPEAPRTLEDWKSLRQEIEERGIAQSKDVVASLGTKVQKTEMSGVPVHVLTPRDLDTQHMDKALIHVHGGGYCLLTAESSWSVSATVADLTKLRVYSIDYRLAPENPFPIGLGDCVDAYRAIIQDVPPQNLGLFGESAGGAMVIAMTLKMQTDRLRTPAAIAAITPWVDLTLSGDSYATNNHLDPVLDAEGLIRTAAAYAGRTSTRDPLVSPLFAEYSKAFPTTLIQTGTRDLLLSDCVRLHRKMKMSMAIGIGPDSTGLSVPVRWLPMGVIAWRRCGSCGIGWRVVV